jgi:hypothetical protein
MAKRLDLHTENCRSKDASPLFEKIFSHREAPWWRVDKHVHSSNDELHSEEPHRKDTLPAGALEKNAISSHARLTRIGKAIIVPAFVIVVLCMRRIARGASLGQPGTDWTRAEVLELLLCVVLLPDLIPGFANHKTLKICALAILAWLAIS